MLNFVNVKLSRDLSFVYNVMCKTDQQSLISRQLRMISFENFEQRFIDDLKFFYHVFYIVQNEKSENIGFAYSYDYRGSDAHCSMVVYVDEAYQKTGTGIEISMRFIDYLFKYHPLRKIYTQIYDYNQVSLECNLQAGFQTEGCFKEYRYYDGKYWDMHILAIERDQFYDRYSKYLQ